MKTKTAEVRFKAGPDDGLGDGEFLVYPSTFTKTPDAYGDVVAKGAFLDSLAEWKSSGNVLPGLYGHRMDNPDYFVAGAVETGEDDHGWWVKGKFDLDSPTGKGPQVYHLVKTKKVAQLSFAFDVQDEGQIELDDGTKANELRKLKVYEFSFVPVGANQDTSVVAVKVAREITAKAGRVISAKNETNLRESLQSLENATAQIKDVLTQLGEAETDQEKAAVVVIAKDEEPATVKSKELSQLTPAKNLIAEVQLLALTGAEGGSL